MAGALARPLPGPVVEKAKQLVLDTLAAMVSGSRLTPGELAIAYVRAQGGTPEAGVAGSDVVTSAVNAAFANGMLAHADETDDVHRPSATHPGCAVVPAALAMAERGGASGEALLRAVPRWRWVPSSSTRPDAAASRWAASSAPAPRRARWPGSVRSRCAGCWPTPPSRRPG
jgi:hypothetical protein